MRQPNTLLNSNFRMFITKDFFCRGKTRLFFLKGKMEHVSNSPFFIYFLIILETTYS